MQKLKKQDLEELLQDILQQLDGCGFEIIEEKMKTVLDIQISYSDVTLLSAHVRKTASNYQHLIDKLCALYALSEDIKHLFKLCSAMSLRVYNCVDTINIKQDYDRPRLKNFVNIFAESTETESLRKDASARLDELEELAEIAEISTVQDSNSITMIDVNSFYDAYETVKSLKNNYAEHRQTFNAVLKVVSDFVRAANKLTTRDNSRYLRELREIREEEQKALERSDYDSVSDETLKQFLKETFYELSNKKLLILDKSSKHRAVCVAVVDYYKTYFPPTLCIEKIYLCGVDDNAEAWIHEILDYTYEPCEIDRFSPLTVEEAMSRLFNVNKEIIENSLRQGDILITKLDNEEISERGKLKVCGKNYSDDVDFFYFAFIKEATEYDIAPSHTLKSKPFKVYAFDNNLTLIELTADALLEHPSHAPVKLEKAIYIFNRSRAAQYYD